MLQRPRSQDISGIPLENKSVHETVENDSHFFSPKQKLNCAKKGNFAWEENRHLSKFLERKENNKGRSNKETKLIFKPKVILILITQIIKI